MSAGTIPFGSRGGAVQVSMEVKGGLESEYSLLLWPDPNGAPHRSQQIVKDMRTAGGRGPLHAMPIQSAELHGAVITWSARAYGPETSVVYHLHLRFQQDDQVIAQFSDKGTMRENLSGHLGAARFQKED